MRISDWSSDVCSSDLPADQVGCVFLVGQPARALRGSALERQHVYRCARGAAILGCVRVDRDEDVGLGRARQLRAAVERDEHVLVARQVGLQAGRGVDLPGQLRSEEHTSELQSLMRISYAVFCLKKKKNKQTTHN